MRCPKCYSRSDLSARRLNSPWGSDVKIWKCISCGFVSATMDFDDAVPEGCASVWDEQREGEL
jgi:Zn ribbon nucleic-acid-binding protein